MPWPRGSRYTAAMGGKKLVAAPDAVMAYVGTTASTADVGVLTFSAHAIGTASAGRYVIVGVVYRVGAPVLTVTVGGISATLIALQVSGSNNIEFWIAAVPTGTTADIVVDYTGTTVRCAISVWEVINLLSTTATTTIADTTMTSGVLTGDLSSIVAGGFAIAMTINSSNTTTTWAGLTEKNDAAVEALITYSSASDSFAAAQGATTIIVIDSSLGSGSSPALLAIAMR